MSTLQLWPYRLASRLTPAPPAHPAPHPESLFQQGELADEVCDGVGEGLLGAVVRCGLHADDDLVFQGVGDFVASKQHLWVLQQLPETQGWVGWGWVVSLGPLGLRPLVTSQAF